MKVAEIMSRQVITIRSDALVAEAAQLMLEHRVSGLPVLDADGELVGIVTEGDLLCRAETGTDRHHHWLEFLIAPGRFTGDYTRAHARQVHEVMSDPVATVAPDDKVEEAVRLMERRGIKRLPVVEAGLVVGIVARADLVRALACKLAERQEVAATDTARMRGGRYPMSTPKIISGLAVTAALIVFAPAGGAKAAASRGEILSQQWCAQCHGVRPNQLSADQNAPSFSAIAAERSATAFSLRTFLRVPHPTMPNFVIKPDDIDDIVDYIMSLKPQK